MIIIIVLIILYIIYLFRWSRCNDRCNRFNSQFKEQQWEKAKKMLEEEEFSEAEEDSDSEIEEEEDEFK